MKEKLREFGNKTIAALTSRVFLSVLAVIVLLAIGSFLPNPVKFAEPCPECPECPRCPDCPLLPECPRCPDLMQSWEYTGECPGTEVVVDEDYYVIEILKDTACVIGGGVQTTGGIRPGEMVIIGLDPDTGEVKWADVTWYEDQLWGVPWEGPH